VVARPDTFPDALAGGAWAGNAATPLVLSGGAARFATALPGPGPIKMLVVVGGELAVPDATVTWILGAQAQ
jgi:hypothetical protein